MEASKAVQCGKTLKALAAVFTALLLAGPATALTIRVAEINDVVDAGTTQYIDRIIKNSETEGVDLVLIEVNTQGGLEKATHEVTKDIIGSKVRIAAYVPKKFEGAFSAGTFVVMAAGVSAVDPQAYIGGAEPTPMDNKTILPLAGYLIALAEGKNKDTGVVRDLVAKNGIMNGREALEKRAIDYAPENFEELLTDLDMSGAEIKASTPSLTEQTYSLLSNPHRIALFLLLGCLGTSYLGQAVYRREYSKRLLIYALIPLVSFAATLWGIENILFSPLGIFLIVLGAGLVTAELFHTRISIFGITGLLSIIIGITTASSEPLLPLDTGETLIVLGLATALVGVSVLAAHRISKQYLETIKAEAESLIGEKAKVVEELRPNGIVKIGEKLRQAYSGAEERIEMGALVQVTKVEGKVLNVERVGGPKKSHGHGHVADDDHDAGGADHGNGHAGHNTHVAHGKNASGDAGHAHSLLPSKTDSNITHDHRSHAPSEHDDQSHHFTAGPDPNFIEHDHHDFHGPDATHRKEKQTK